MVYLGCAAPALRCPPHAGNPWAGGRQFHYWLLRGWLKLADLPASDRRKTHHVFWALARWEKRFAPILQSLWEIHRSTRSVYIARPASLFRVARGKQGHTQCTLGAGD